MSSFWQCVIVTFSITSVSIAQSPNPTWSTFQNGGYPLIGSDTLPTAWAPDKNIVWKSAIDGYGQSTPVVADGQIYVTSVSGDDRDTYHLAAFSLTSGKRVWQKDFDNPTPQENTPMTSRAAPSPVAETTGCFAYFEGGIVVSVDRHGEIRWKRDLIDEYGPADTRHGFAASLEHDERHVFVWVERTESPYVLAIDKVSGKNHWKAEGVGATSWSSPRLIPTEAGDHLVCSASGKIIGLDPNTGQILWEFSDIANNTSCTPIRAGKGRFLIGASDGRGEESAGRGSQYNGVIEIKREGDQYSASYAWQATKASSSFGSPVVANNAVYIVNRTGVLYKLNLDTGKSEATNRTGAGGIWATPIASDEHLYLFGQKGTTSVISLANGKEIAANQLWTPKDETSRTSGSVLYAAAAVPPYLVLQRGDMLFAVKTEN